MKDKTQKPRRCDKPREPVLVFLSKAAALSVTMVAAAFVVLSWFQVSYDPQDTTSLPWRMWVTVKFDDTVARGDYAAFLTGPAAAHYFEPGTRFVKKIVAVPGDRVVVRHGKVRINGEIVAGLPLADALGKPLSAFDRELVVSAGRYWVMGTSKRSYDSRYWGTISAEQVIGQSYPIF